MTCERSLDMPAEKPMAEGSADLLGPKTWLIARVPHPPRRHPPPTFSLDAPFSLSLSLAFMGLLHPTGTISNDCCVF